MWFPTRFDTNRAQKMARDWKVWIQVIEKLYYPSCENRGADQLRITAKLFCVFIFACAKCLLSHDEEYINK